VLDLAAGECRDENTLALVLIGSIARPVEYVHDVDLLFIYSNRRPRLSGHPLDVDIRAFSASDLEKLVAKGNELIAWSVRFGKVVCQHQAYWSHLITQWKTNAPIISPSVPIERALKAEIAYKELLALGDLEAAHEQLTSALTHRAWACLLTTGVFPASRPELPAQLRAIGETTLAIALEEALSERRFQATAAVHAVSEPSSND
jgi:hypothetical protein